MKIWCFFEYDVLRDVLVFVFFNYKLCMCKYNVVDFLKEIVN